MRISMRDISEADSDILAGALSGRQTFLALLEETQNDPKTPSPVFLDFEGVQVATASYLRESVLAFRDTVRRARSNWYPVVANATEVVKEELKLLVSTHGNALMLCELDQNKNPIHPQLLGDLEPKQQLTFDLVQQHGVTDASTLMKEHGESEQMRFQTAWNNRLSSLANLGLVMEIKQGRTKRYRPLFGEE